MGIVDDLLAGAGLYVGPETADGAEVRAAARILVTALPGAAGVSLDDEIGRLRHAWWYGMPGGELTERDVAVVERVGGPPSSSVGAG